MYPDKAKGTKMNIATALKKVKEKGAKGTLKYCMKKMHLISGNAGGEKVYKILLLTNRDSDNVGDQVIEACDIALISTVMKNLNIDTCNYKILSRPASIISQKYLATQDPELLLGARKLIEQSDIVIFGGAPLFNYLYQNFYERTALTLELAREYQKPVIFSAIGVERYDEDNEKCQRLKKTLNFDCVKQITTRDGFSLLQKYVENENIVVGKVSDPAVFTAKVFENYMVSDKPDTNKKIGIFILRANGFVDNKIDFTREDAAALWLSLIHDLEEKNYDYELLTSGHFGDEAFLDYLIRNYNVDEKKCIFNINTPERLIQKISSYDGVISCRLHPSIISFSLGVPSLGIVWNSKVKGFYSSIGYENRMIDIGGIKSQELVEKLEQAMAEGVVRDEEYLTSVYTTLFQSMKGLLRPGDSSAAPYDYSELMQQIPVYKGTSAKEQEEKLKRKFRRTYNMCNERFDKVLLYEKMIDDAKSE